MAKNKFSAKRIPNGTYGAVWLDAERLAECYGCQGKVQVSSDTINLCGQFMEASKPVSAKGTGSLMLYKVDSGLIQKLQSIQDGQVPEFTVCPTWPTRTAPAPSASPTTACSSPT